MAEHNTKRERRAAVAEDLLVIMVLLVGGLVIAAIKVAPAIVRWIKNS